MQENVMDLMNMHKLPGVYGNLSHDTQKPLLTMVYVM